MSDDDIERQKLEIERGRLHNDGERLKLEHFKIQADVMRTSHESIIRFADITIRSLLILNGATALALLTFARTEPSVKGMTWVVMWLGAGAVLAVVTAGLSYLAQVFFTEAAEGRWGYVLGNSFRIAAIAAAIFSLGCFCWGIFKAASLLG